MSHYDVSRDGRFVAAEIGSDTYVPRQLVVTSHWVEQLKAIVGR